MKKAIALIVIGIMVLQIFSILIAPVNAETDDNFLQKKLDEIVPGEIIVKFKNGLDYPEISKVNSRYGLSVISSSKFAGFQRLKVPQGKTVSEIVEIYKKNPNVEYAEPNYIAHALMIPNDPYYGYQWHLHDVDAGGINMAPSWDIATGSGAVIAVIDTGIRVGSDLSGTCFVSGYDFVNNDNNPVDDNGHGTHVAGTVAQSTNNNLGVAGVAFDACLMPVKALDRYGSGYYSDIVDGIYFAVDNGANIISMSFGGSYDSQALEDAVAYAYNNGVSCIAASGNDGQNGVIYPAAYDDYVIAVGATQYDKTRAPYSNYGSSLDVVAPGGNLALDQNGDGYGDGVLQQTFSITWWGRISWGYYFYDGTSMAAPHVSGVAALLYSNGVTSPDEIRNVLESTAVDLGSSGWDSIYGHGLINAYDALQYGTGDNPPSVSVISPADSAIITGNVNIHASASDDNGIVKVDFYVDGIFLGSDYSEPYSWPWGSTSVGDGFHTITATAIDTASQSTSDIISVTVDNVNDPPVANAGSDQTVSDADDTGSEMVTLDGSASYDPDGTISSYKWTEGTTVLGTTAVITYDFSVGAHIVTLNVTDDDGASSSDETIITVNANQAPISNAGSDQNAYVDDTVEFDGSGSYDPDGNIVSYNWDFGDGTNANGVTVSHVYPTAGVYAITLIVTDNGGLTASDQAIVTVEEAPSETVEFYDSFEVSEWNGLWVEDSQNDWFRSTQRATDGSRSAEVDGMATDATLTMADPIDLSGKTGATLTFSWFIERGFDSGEYIALDIFDGSWHEIKRLSGNVDQENVWHHETIDLTPYMVNNFKIRFRAKVSSSWEDGNVDNVKIVSVGGEPNNPPDAPTNLVPSNGATDIGISPTLSVDVSDPDGDAMDVTFYDASDDSIIGTDTNIPSGGTATVTWSGLDYETTYNWYAVADDGKDSTPSTTTWSFTTEVAPPNNPPDTPANPVPVDGVAGIGISPTLLVDVNDIDGDTMTVSFYEQGGTLIGTDAIVGSGTATITWTTANQYLTTYYWYAVANDGIDSTQSAEWSFTTESEPSEIVEFSDSFEVSEWNGLWVENSQNDWYRYNRRASDGSYSAEVDGRATDATLTMTDPIDLSGKTGATLTFSWFIERGFDSGEYIALDIFDGTWHEIKRLSGNVDQENVWHHETIDLTPYMVNNFKIRFRAKASRSNEDGNVDNVKIVSIL